MAAAIETELDTALRDLSELLEAIGEPGFASSMATLRRALLDAETREERRHIIGPGLAIFGGMNSLNDVVIMHGVSPNVEANRRLDSLRTRVYKLLVQHL